jgi:outer membrane protein assembly factor BamE (lipoprotein component of BamABCDE complex)
MRNLLLLLSAALFSLTACEACEKDSPREELREDIQQVGENVDDAVDESRVGMN